MPKQLSFTEISTAFEKYAILNNIRISASGTELDNENTQYFYIKLNNTKIIVYNKTSHPMFSGQLKIENTNKWLYFSNCDDMINCITTLPIHSLFTWNSINTRLDKLMTSS